MSQAAVELSEVKSIIRGLLISSSTETTIRQLEIDYRKHDGTLLPYKSFGYPSAEAFLRSIPDTVHLRESSRGCPANLYIVEPVQSKKSEHVEKMVIRQKSSKAVRGMKRTSAVSQPRTQNRASSDNSRLNGMAPRFIPSSLRLSMARVWQRHAPKGLPLSSLGNELSLDLSMAGWAQNGKSGWLNTYGFSSINEVIDGLTDQGLIKITNRNGKEWVTCSLNNGVLVPSFGGVQIQRNTPFSEVETDENLSPQGAIQISPVHPLQKKTPSSSGLQKKGMLNKNETEETIKLSNAGLQRLVLLEQLSTARIQRQYYNEMLEKNK